MYLIYLIYYGNTMIFLSTLEYHASTMQVYINYGHTIWMHFGASPLYILYLII